MDYIFIKNKILQFIKLILPGNSIKAKIIYIAMSTMIISTFIICVLSITIITSDKKKSLAERMYDICENANDDISDKKTQLLEEIKILSAGEELNKYITAYDDNYILEVFRNKKDLFKEISFINTDYKEELKIINGENSDNYISFVEDDEFKKFLNTNDPDYMITDDFIFENIACVRIFYKLKDQYHDIIGYLSFVVKTEVIIESVIKETFEKAGFVYLVNQKGKILYHIDKKNIFQDLKENNKTDTPLIKNIINKKSNFTRSALMGIDAYIYFMPVKDFNWTIIATLPFKQFLIPIYYFIFYFIIINIFLFLLCFISISLISKKLTNSLIVITDRIKKIANGNIDQLEKVFIQNKDEVGILAVSFNTMLESLKYKLNIIKAVAEEGNLNFDIKQTSDDDVLGKALGKMLESLNYILTQFKEATFQIASNAEQVSEISQTLSQGATEQAGILGEITSSNIEINEQSKENVNQAELVNKISKEAVKNAQSGNALIKDLVIAMKKIIDSSRDVNKIAKIIDDIAFQTNILALNANVEAARAGKYGKGFYVVAEEVRNLALKSAEAVKQTEEIINESIKNIENANKLVSGTSIKLDEIVLQAVKTTELVGTIAVQSKLQTKILSEINNRLLLIEKVTQTNTASAEEIASASEEFAAHSQMLKRLLLNFKLKDNLK